MNSILPENEFVRCPNCSNMISSFSPTCAKCGLSASEDGIRELAFLDERNLTALADAQTLVNFAASPYPLFVIASLSFSLLPEITITLILFTVVYLGVFWWKYFAWNRNHLNNEFPDNNFDAAKRAKRTARILGSIASGAAFVFFYSKI